MHGRTTTTYSSICSFGKKFPFILSKNVSLILSFNARCLSLLSKTFAEGILVRRSRGRSSSPVVVALVWWSRMAASFFLWSSSIRLIRIRGYVSLLLVTSKCEFSAGVRWFESFFS